MLGAARSLRGARPRGVDQPWVGGKGAFADRQIAAAFMEECGREPESLGVHFSAAAVVVEVPPLGERAGARGQGGEDAAAGASRRGPRPCSDSRRRSADDQILSAPRSPTHGAEPPPPPVSSCNTSVRKLSDSHAPPYTGAAKSSARR
jgi:hypothetical protein